MQGAWVVAAVAAVLVLCSSGVAGQNGSILLNPETQTVAEATANAVVTVIRTSGSVGVVSVDYATVAGSAVAGADYVATSGTLTWAAGETGAKDVVVGIVDDADFELVEDFTVVLSNPTGGAVFLGATTATIRIDESDRQAGYVTLAAATFSVAESVGSLSVSVTRDGGADGDACVNYQTVALTAIAPDDFTATSGQFVWANQDSSVRTIVVAIVDDTDFEPDETFRLSLSECATGSDTVIGTDKAVVTILQSDQVAGTVQFSTASTTVAEDSGLSTVVVTRTGGSDGAVSVEFVAEDVTTVPGVDYSFTPGVLTWDSGDDTPKSVRFDVIDDTAYEPTTEEFRIRLRVPSGGVALGAASVFSVFIVGPNDQQAGTINFDPTAVSVAEEAGSVTAFLTRTGGADGPVSVTVQTSAFEAVAGSDYVELAPTVVAWPNGDATPKPVVVSLIDDDIFEQAEIFRIVASQPTGGVVVNEETVEVSIQRSDQQAGVVALTTTFIRVDEDVGAIQLLITRTSPEADGEVSVQYRTVDGSAVGSASLATPGDFRHETGQVTWGNRDNTTRSVVIIVADDTEFEPDEEFVFELFDPAGGVTLGTASATIRIAGNDLNPGYLAFAADGAPCGAPCAVEIAENFGTLSLPVKRLAGFNSAVSVEYILLGGSATAPQDFTGSSGTLTWLNGDNSDKLISIPIVDDALFEESESFTVRLRAPVGAPLGTHIEASVTIAGPNDVVGGTVGFVEAEVRVSEEDGSVSVVVRREGGDDRFAAVDFSVAPDSASAPSDYTAVAGNLTWANGDATPRTIVVPLVDDAVFEVEERFVILLSNYVGDGSLGLATLSVFIAESDRQAGRLAFTQPVFEFAESVGVFSIDVERVGGTDGLVTVGYAAQAGSATDGLDYELVPGNVVWASGEGGIKSITGTIVDDTEFEQVDEAFTVVLSGATGGATLVAPSSAAVLISGPNDFAAGVVGFETTTVQVNEESGAVRLTIRRVDGADGVVTVQYATVAGTATSGIDYLARNSTAVLPNTVASTTITIPLIDDAEYERVESLQVVITSVAGGAGLDQSRATASVFILDDFDRNAGKLAVACPVVAVNEGAGVLSIEVARVGGRDGFVSVVAEVVNGSAKIGYDVVGTGLGVGVYPLNWTDTDDTPAIVNITIVDDAVFEQAEVFYLRLRDATGGAAIDDTPVEVYIRGPNDLENEVPAALRSASVAEDKSEWEWIGPLALGVALLLLLLVCLFLALCIMYLRSARKPVPVAVDRHEVVVDPNQPAHATEVLEVRHEKAGWDAGYGAYSYDDGFGAYDSLGDVVLEDDHAYDDYDDGRDFVRGDDRDFDGEWSR